MAIIKLDGYSCDRCDHKWFPRIKIDVLPIICPKCKSPYWNTPRRQTNKKERLSKKDRTRYR